MAPGNGPGGLSHGASFRARRLAIVGLGVVTVLIMQRVGLRNPFIYVVLVASVLAGGVGLVVGYRILPRGMAADVGHEESPSDP